jgi:hypothetical protein
MPFIALVGVQVSALKPVNQQPCLLDVSAKRGCFNPHRGCRGVPAGDILTLDPS